MSGRRWTAALALGGLCMTGWALQPERRPAPPPPSADRAPEQPEEDRAAMRERLQRRLVEMDRLRQRVEAAIKKLDEGASIDSVRAEVFPPGEMRRGAGVGPAKDAASVVVAVRPATVRRAVKGRHPAGRRMRPPAAADPEADRQMVLTFLEQHDPAGAQRMRDVLRDRPEDGARWVGRSAARIRPILSERDEALRGLRLREYLVGRRAVAATRRLGDALGEGGNAADADAARAELTAALGEQFDVRMKVHQREIEVLEERVASLKRELTEQQGRRAKFIEDRAEEIRQATREWAERARGTPRPPG